MPAEPAIGQRIMRRRQALDMSQEDLALAVGVTRSTVSNWEVGKHFPKKYLGKVEAVLGISLDTGSYRPVSPQMRRMVAETLDDPEEQRRVIGLLEGTLTWPGEDEGQQGRHRRDAAG